MSQWEAGRVPAGIDDAFKLVAFAESVGVQVAKAAADPILEAQMTEAAKAGLIERRSTVRRVADRQRLAAAGQGV